MVHLLGIRHHGPGSARAVAAALDRIRPEVVLVEGPPDAEGLLEYVTLDGEAGVEPPAAILVWAADDDGRLARAVFYPFAVFSPEWQAFVWARQNGATLRFCDLPQAISMMAEDDAATGLIEGGADGLDVIARAAGFEDREAWWEQEIELRHGIEELFPAVEELMLAARDPLGPASRHEARREAAMRERIRAAEKMGAQNIVVVVGAWHVPALRLEVRVATRKSDPALLRGLPRTHARACWIPWTYARLGARNGYGAGVGSPGWYTHVWERPDAPAASWLARCAELLREQGEEVSSAQVLDALRLADTLAALRDQRRPGLAELQDAVVASMSQGNEQALRSLRARLDVGERIGRVPSGAPTPPLTTDIARRQRQLRLRPTANIQVLSLDLREPRDREKSVLLHQLRLIEVPWGRPVPVKGARGSFHEQWELAWNVEFPVQILEANVYGNTLPEAASARLTERLEQADLAALVGLLQAAIAAALSGQLPALLHALQQRVAEIGDLRSLIATLGPLSLLQRYGDVRGAPPLGLAPLIEELVLRLAVGLPGACAWLDDPSAVPVAAALRSLPAMLERVQGATLVYESLARVAEDRRSAPRLRGTALRLGLEAERPDTEAGLATSLARELRGPHRDAAVWLEGFLTGPASHLLRHESLWMHLDAFLAGLDRSAFMECLPVLRRGFSAFEPAERRLISERLRRGPRPPASAGLHAERAERVMPLLRRLLDFRGEEGASPPTAPTA